jgi:hypothetical protein
MDVETQRARRYLVERLRFITRGSLSNARESSGGEVSQRAEIWYDNGWWAWQIYSGLHGGRWVSILRGWEVRYEDAAQDMLQALSNISRTPGSKNSG